VLPACFFPYPFTSSIPVLLWASPLCLYHPDPFFSLGPVSDPGPSSMGTSFPLFSLRLFRIRHHPFPSHATNPWSPKRVKNEVWPHYYFAFELIFPHQFFANEPSPPPSFNWRPRMSSSTRGPLYDDNFFFLIFDLRTSSLSFPAGCSFSRRAGFYISHFCWTLLVQQWPGGNSSPFVFFCFPPMSSLPCTRTPPRCVTAGLLNVYLPSDFPLHRLNFPSQAESPPSLGNTS